MKECTERKRINEMVDVVLNIEKLNEELKQTRDCEKSDEIEEKIYQLRVDLSSIVRIFEIEMKAIVNVERMMSVMRETSRLGDLK